MLVHAFFKLQRLPDAHLAIGFTLDVIDQIELDDSYTLDLLVFLDLDDQIALLKVRLLHELTPRSIHVPFCLSL